MFESRISVLNGGTHQDFSLWETKIEAALNGRYLIDVLIEEEAEKKY